VGRTGNYRIIYRRGGHKGVATLEATSMEPEPSALLKFLWKFVIKYRADLCNNEFSYRLNF
jgi:hypothetical protein